MTKKISLVVISAICMLLFTATAVSKETAMSILAKVDANLTKVQDQTYEATLKVIKGGVVTKELGFTAKLKGLRKKLITFTSPGDVKGMTVLTTDDDKMYIYLPSFNRVRMVADSHVRNQGFMGTDFSAEDMGTAALSINWNAVLNSSDEKNWYLTITPKPNNETVFERVKVTVLKKYGGVSKLEYYNKKGKLAKTQTRSKWQTFGPISIPMFYVVEDHKTGSKTEMTFLNCKLNKGIPDRVFSKRSIQRKI